MWVKSDCLEVVEVCDRNPDVVWAVVLMVRRSVPIVVVFAGIPPFVIVAIFLARVSDKLAVVVVIRLPVIVVIVIADISLIVVVVVELVVVGLVTTVVLAVRDSIAVTITTPVADVANPVLIGIFLIWIPIFGAVVTDVSQAVPVGVLLVPIGMERAVVVPLAGIARFAAHGVFVPIAVNVVVACVCFSVFICVMLIVWHIRTQVADIPDAVSVSITLVGVRMVWAVV